MAGKWIQVRPGEKVRRVGENEWEYKREGSLVRTRNLNKELQKASKESPDILDTKGETGRMIANMPLAVAGEMDEKCGYDPEKRKAFLRDHPEFLTTQDANLPKRKTHIFPERMRTRQ